MVFCRKNRGIQTGPHVSLSDMALPFSAFVARRLRTGGSDSFTRRIILVAKGTIALCVAVIVLAHATILGFKQEIKAKVFGFWGHIDISGYALNQTFESPPISRNQVFRPVLDTLGSIRYEEEVAPNQWVEKRTMGGIRHVQEYILKPSILTAKDQLEGILLKGVGADYQWEFLANYLEEGEVLRVSDSIPQREIWVSRTTADRLSLAIGDPLILHFIRDGRQRQRRFAVTGIYRTGLEEYDQKFAIIDLRHIRQLSGWEPDQITGFEILVDDLADLDALTAYIYYEHLPAELQVSSIRQKFPAIFDWVDLQDINERVLIILMIIVALINLATVLLILILERVNMVGVLKAMGASAASIRQIFVRLSLRILLGGLIVGNVAGIGLGLLQQHFGIIKLNEAEYYLDRAPIAWNPWFILGLNGLILLVAAIIMLVPAMYTAAIQPVKAIRFK